MINKNTNLQEVMNRLEKGKFRLEKVFNGRDQTMRAKNNKNK